jgi:hypothetical protein
MATKFSPNIFSSDIQASVCNIHQTRYSAGNFSLPSKKQSGSALDDLVGDEDESEPIEPPAALSRDRRQMLFSIAAICRKIARPF